MLVWCSVSLTHSSSATPSTSSCGSGAFWDAVCSFTAITLSVHEAPGWSVGGTFEADAALPNTVLDSDVIFTKLSAT